MTIFAVISFCSLISIQEIYGFPYFYSFILCKYTLLTTTKSFLFLYSCKLQKNESMITSLIFTRQIFIQTILPIFIEIIVQRYLLCLIDYKVKALLGIQNLHTYG